MSRIRIDLGSNQAHFVDGMSVKLSPQETEMLWRLDDDAAKGRISTLNGLMQCLYGLGDGPEKPLRVIYTVIFHLRRLLEPRGMWIESIVGKGYVLHVSPKAWPAGLLGGAVMDWPSSRPK